MNDYKTSLDNEPTSQQQTYQYYNKKNPQPSLSTLMPSLQLLWRYQIEKGLNHNSIEKDFLDNKDENNEKYIQNSIIKYSLNTGKVIDYYNQISQPMIQLFFDIAKLQKDCINTFNFKWTVLMKTNGEKCLIFQHNIIICFILEYILYILRISYNIKEQQKMKGGEMFIKETKNENKK